MHRPDGLRGCSGLTGSGGCGGSGPFFPQSIGRGGTPGPAGKPRPTGGGGAVQPVGPMSGRSSSPSAWPRSSGRSSSAQSGASRDSGGSAGTGRRDLPVLEPERSATTSLSPPIPVAAGMSSGFSLMPCPCPAGRVRCGCRPSAASISARNPAPAPRRGSMRASAERGLDLRTNRHRGGGPFALHGQRGSGGGEAERVGRRSAFGPGDGERAGERVARRRGVHRLHRYGGDGQPFPGARSVQGAFGAERDDGLAHPAEQEVEGGGGSGGAGDAGGFVLVGQQQGGGVEQVV